MMDHSLFDDDKYADAYYQASELSRSPTFANWSANYWDTLWNMYETLQKQLEHCPGICDRARFVDFLEFVANTSTSCPESPPKLHKPFTKNKQWNLCAAGTRPCE